MRRNLITSIIAFLIVFCIQAQDDNANNTDDFSKWQMRFRVLSVIPSADDDIPDADIDISTAFVPEVDFTYFFTENFAAELILATTKHNVDVEGADLGHVWLLPPTLNFQYHFTGGPVTPYLGAGVNYTIFYGVDAGDLVDMEYENSFGFSFQAGLDYDLNGKWFLNLDLKQILLSTDVDADTGDGVLPVEVDINPFVIGLGAGFKF